MSRIRRISWLLFLLALVSSIATAEAGVEGNYRVAFPYSVGKFKVGGTPRQAVTAFGPPARFQEDSPATCTFTWVKKGLTLTFRSPSSSPCGHDGRAQATWISTTILSRRWNVVRVFHGKRGVRVGDSCAGVRRLFALQAPCGSETRLAQRAVPKPHTQYRIYVDLDAFFRRGRVVRFEFHYGR
jgi:hypothetical protein